MGYRPITHIWGLGFWYLCCIWYLLSCLVSDTGVSSYAFVLTEFLFMWMVAIEIESETFCEVLTDFGEPSEEGGRK